MFDVKTETERLQKNKLMRTDEEIDEFELAIDNFLELDDFKNVKYLLMGFDDKTRHREVMWRLIHVVESYRECDNYYDIFAKNIMNIYGFAYSWVETLHFRILNSEDDQKRYVYSIKKLPKDIKNKILQLMLHIQEEETDIFGEKVNKFLQFMDLV